MIDPDPGQAGRIAVVIAAHELNSELGDCLAGHQAECGAGDEIIVVGTGSGGAADRIAERFPRARWLHASADTLTPRLWSLGLDAAAAPLVLVTIGPCRPAAGWRRALVAALGADAAGVGGAIEPGAQLRARDRAIYVLRYRNYRLPFERRERVDLPGDHAGYVRSALLRTRELWRDGFWEMDVNRALAAAGERLILDPDLVAHYRGGERARRFLAQRFRHGVHFGRARLTGQPAWRRWALAAAFLLPGIVFFAKILREAGAHDGRRRVWTAGCLPWLLVFLAAWSLGEWVGALRGPQRAARPDVPR